MHRPGSNRRASPALRFTAALAVSGLCLSRPIVAQDTQPAPAAQPLVAKIVALKGVVQVRNAEAEPWKPATIGLELDEGAEFRTGPRSAVQFVIPPDQTVTLDRLGTIKVLEAVKNSGKVTTALGMKYGRTRYDIQAADLEHDSSIRSPGSTLAIRGTDVTFEDMVPFPPSATSREGRATFRNAKRQTIAFGGTTRANVSAERSSPAETAIVQTRTDPQSAFSGRSETEQQLVTQLPSFGGADLSQAGVQTFQDQAKQETLIIPAAASNIIASELLIELFWTGDPFSDVDIRVEREGEFVKQDNGVSPTGGRHLGNGVADSTGNGREAILWSPSHPTGKYLITGFEGALAPATNEITRADLFVTQDPGGAGIRVAQFLDIEPPEEADSVTLEVTVPPTPADGSSTLAPGAARNRTGRAKPAFKALKPAAAPATAAWRRPTRRGNGP